MQLKITPISIIKEGLHGRNQIEALPEMRQTGASPWQTVFRWNAEDYLVVSEDVPEWRDLYDLWELRADCESLEPEG